MVWDWDEPATGTGPERTRPAVRLCGDAAAVAVAVGLEEGLLAGGERDEGKPATSVRTVWLELLVCAAPEVLVVVADFGGRAGAEDVGEAV